MNEEERREEEFAREVGSQARRKRKARREKHLGLWYGLGMFGLVGWSVSIPTVIGVAIGWWLDHRLVDRFSWTLTGLAGGVVLGCINAWYWVQRHRQEREDE